MNKKLVAITTSLVVGGGLLLGTSYASASQLSGYEAYKSAVMSTKDLKNVTANVTLSLYDNGSDLIDVNSNMKMNMDANAMSETTSIKSANGTSTMSTFKQDGKNIVKSMNSDVYTVMANNRKNFSMKKRTENPQMQKSIETVIDTLVGSMKDNVSVVSNDDGTKKVNISLNENQIIPLVNAITSMAFANGNNEEFHNNKGDLANIKSLVPQLVNDIKVKSVEINGDINKDNTIKDQVGKIVITGTDANGKAHEITINVNLSLSNVNSTTPDKVDLTGKQVKTITQKDRVRD